MSPKHKIGTLSACLIMASPALAQHHEKPDQTLPKMDHSEMDHSLHDLGQSKQEAYPTDIVPGTTIITAKVNGLVCDFCAQALRKVFNKEDAVDHINVDLDAGQVLIALKPKSALDDTTVKELIRNSGYSLVSISRNIKE